MSDFAQTAENFSYSLAGVWIVFALMKMKGKVRTNKAERHWVILRYDVAGGVLAHWGARGEKRCCQVPGDTLSVSFFHAPRCLSTLKLV